MKPFGFGKCKKRRRKEGIATKKRAMASTCTYSSFFSLVVPLVVALVVSALTKHVSGRRDGRQAASSRLANRKLTHKMTVSIRFVLVIAFALWWPMIAVDARLTHRLDKVLAASKLDDGGRAGEPWSESAVPPTLWTSAKQRYAKYFEGPQVCCAFAWGGRKARGGDSRALNFQCISAKVGCEPEFMYRQLRPWDFNYAITVVDSRLYQKHSQRIPDRRKATYDEYLKGLDNIKSSSWKRTDNELFINELGSECRDTPDGRRECRVGCGTCPVAKPATTTTTIDPLRTWRKEQLVEARKITKSMREKDGACKVCWDNTKRCGGECVPTWVACHIPPSSATTCRPPSLPKQCEEMFEEAKAMAVAREAAATAATAIATIPVECAHANVKPGVIKFIGGAVCCEMRGRLQLRRTNCRTGENRVSQSTCCKDAPSVNTNANLWEVGYNEDCDRISEPSGANPGRGACESGTHHHLVRLDPITRDEHCYTRRCMVSETDAEQRELNRYEFDVKTCRNQAEQAGSETTDLSKSKVELKPTEAEFKKANDERDQRYCSRYCARPETIETSFAARQVGGEWQEEDHFCQKLDGEDRCRAESQRCQYSKSDGTCIPRDLGTHSAGAGCLAVWNDGYVEGLTIAMHVSEIHANSRL